MDFKQIAIDTAKKAGKAVFELSKGEIKYEMKKRRDILAEADLKSEKIIIDSITKSFPDHSILSEEAGENFGKSDYLWVIDPIDGTINFSRRIKEYCISIALDKSGKTILGVIYEPYNDRLYVAEKGKGAFLNDQKVKVSTEINPINMLLAADNTSDPELRTKNYKILVKVCNDFRHIRILGSGALHVARVATGSIDAYYHTHCNYWDYAAANLLLEEAGGVVTDMAGNKFTKDSKDIFVSNGKVHDKILKLLNS